MVGAEAAGRHDDDGGVEGRLRAGAQVGGAHAGHGAVGGEDLVDAHLGHGRHAALGALGAHAVHDEGAHGAAVLGTVDAAHRGAARGAEAVEDHAALLEALEGSVGVLAHERDEVHVAELVAAGVGVLGKELDAVLDALGLLVLGAAGVHAALGAHGVAAGHGHLLEQQHLGAAVVRAHGGGHARTARADDDDVVRGAGRIVAGLGSLGDRLFGGLLVGEGGPGQDGGDGGDCAEPDGPGDERAAAEAAVLDVLHGGVLSLACLRAR